MNKGLVFLLAVSVLLVIFGIHQFHWQGVDVCNGSLKGSRYVCGGHTP
jgi:hypothetical protein